MYPDLAGKRALVTGGSQGIGAAAARRLAAEGCDVVIVARSQANLDSIKAAVERESGRRIDAVAMDLGDSATPKLLAARFPDVDILVNNAGDDPAGRLADIDEARWRAAWDVKAFGYINMCREFYPLMQARGGGVIINVIGLAHIRKEAGYILGATVTASLTVFTQALGGASLKDNIRVVGINPGTTATPRVYRHRPKGDDPGAAPDAAADRAFVDRMAQTIGVPRSGDPAEIAAAIAFAASAEASYMTGVSLNIDGGVSRS